MVNESKVSRRLFMGMIHWWTLLTSWQRINNSWALSKSQSINNDETNWVIGSSYWYLSCEIILINSFICCLYCFLLISIAIQRYLSKWGQVVCIVLIYLQTIWKKKKSLFFAKFFIFLFFKFLTNLSLLLALKEQINQLLFSFKRIEKYK